jgi:hypothetical protein
MRWPVSYTRTLLIAGALSVAVGAAIYLVRTEAPTSIGCSPTDDPRSYSFQSLVTLTFKELRPAGNQFAGSFTMEVYPRQEPLTPEDAQRLEKDFKDLKEVVLRFDHFESNSDIYRGGSDSPVALAFPAASGSLQGKGTFSWAGVPQLGPFFYPFDSYVLQVNPSILQVTDSNSYPVYPVHTLVTDFGNSNFIPHLNYLHTKSPNDLYAITVQRPVLLRALAIIVGILLVVWLTYLIWFAKAEEYAGQVVTLFVGVFSIRNSLLSGAPVFPSLIDYCALAIYLSAVLIVLIKWMFPDKNRKECPFCLSSIPLKATTCPQCTKAVEIPT